jgi:hypothetical protein
MVSRRWLIAALAVLGLAGGCSQFNTNLTSQTSSSALTFLSPAHQPAGGTDFTLTANGGGFVTGAMLLWNVGPNQVQLTPTSITSTQLIVSVPASDITAAGTIAVAIQIPGSAVSGTSGTAATTTTEISNLVNFTVDPMPGPPPTITPPLSASTTSLPSTPYCSPAGFILTVTGSNFSSGSVVNWDGSPRATMFINSGQLTASILPQDAAFPGTANVSVSNASGTSTAVLFTMATPMAILPSPGSISLSSTSTTAGSPTFTLTVTGSNFVPCSVVEWDGSQKATTFVSSTQLTATIPASDIFTATPPIPPSTMATARTVNVTVFTLGPGGGSSGAKFTINP